MGRGWGLVVVVGVVVVVVVVLVVVVEVFKVGHCFLGVFKGFGF